MKKSTGFTLIELLITLAIGAILLTVIGSIAGCGDGFGYSDGDRYGSVQKLSYKGIACKTWEGQLAMAGVMPTYGSDSNGNTVQTGVTNIFEFTVRDPAVIEQVKEAAASGKRVRLHYDQRIFYSPCRSATGYFITEVGQ
jgi:prepilin-type N-terminal cleavage/methylation domain-containing protein